MKQLFFTDSKKIVPIFFIVFFSMASQAIIFREFLSAFDSGIIAVSLFFFSWLIWISISSFALIKLSSLRSFFAEIAPQSFLIYIPALALQILLFLNFREIAGIEQYHQLHPLNCLLYSLLLNFPVSILTAIFFQSASDILAKDKTAPIPLFHLFIDGKRLELSVADLHQAYFFITATLRYLLRFSQVPPYREE